MFYPLRFTISHVVLPTYFIPTTLNFTFPHKTLLFQLGNKRVNCYQWLLSLTLYTKEVYHIQHTFRKVDEEESGDLLVEHVVILAPLTSRVFLDSLYNMVSFYGH